MYKPRDFKVGGKFDFDYKSPFGKTRHYPEANLTEIGEDSITVSSDLGSRMAELRFGAEAREGKLRVVTPGLGFPRTFRLKEIANLRPSEIEDPQCYILYIEAEIVPKKGKHPWQHW
jgi:hypothetical protein